MRLRNSAKRALKRETLNSVRQINRSALEARHETLRPSRSLLTATTRRLREDEHEQMRSMALMRSVVFAL